MLFLSSGHVKGVKQSVQCSISSKPQSFLSNQFSINFFISIGTIASELNLMLYHPLMHFNRQRVLELDPVHIKSAAARYCIAIDSQATTSRHRGKTRRFR